MTGRALEVAYGGRDNLEAMRSARNYNAHLLDLIRRYVVGPDVMDFGAGAGTFAIPLASEYERILCVEPDPDLARALRSAGQNTVPDLSVVPHESLDSIYSLNVLEHIEDDRTTLGELRARLRAGGLLLLFVPAFMVLYSAMDRKVGHFRRYHRAELEERLRCAGFDVVVSRYVDSIGFFATLAYRLFGSRSGELSPKSVAMYDRLVFPISRTADLATNKLFGKNLLVVGCKPKRG